MLGTLRQSCRCTCTCLLQSSTSAWSLTAIRKYENPHTAVFERMHAVGRASIRKYPLLKKRHYILKKIPYTGEYKTTMKCILTKEIEDIGLKGTVVEVPKNMFRSHLYPLGFAVYASPENMKVYDAYRKDSEEEGITYEIKQLMKKMAGFHLRVFMNKQEKWTLTPSHLRIAFRKMGVVLNEENIILPEKPIQKFENFTFKLQMLDRIACQVRGTVYPIGEDGLPPQNINFPPAWGNKPINPSKPTEFLKKNARKEKVSEKSARHDTDNAAEVTKEPENSVDKKDEPDGK